MLVRILQSLPELLSTSHEKNPMFELSVQRAAAVVTLLVNVTQTAGCTVELQAKLSRWALCHLFHASEQLSCILFSWETWLYPSLFVHFIWRAVPHVSSCMVGCVAFDMRTEGVD